MGKRAFGPLPTVVVEAFRAELLDQGYRPSSAESLVAVIRDLNRWLAKEELTPGDLVEAHIERFASTRYAAGHRRYRCVRELAPVVGFLRGAGLCPPPAAPPPTPVTDLVDAYRAWMVGQRGLAGRTVARYEATAARLLCELVADGGAGAPEDLCAARVRAFLQRDCTTLSVASAKTRAGEVRALLRFLFVEGYTPAPLTAAVPSVAGWRGAALPGTVGPEVVASLLASCDRSRATGRRDFAVLSLLARLGLRAAEVAALELNDVDWRAGEVAVAGKSRRRDRLPLPADVGEALVDYLTDGRPVVATRRVFVRGRAPRTGIRPATVSTIVGLAFERAGVPPVGAHRLRHALATETLRRGGSLAEVSQLLRHRDLATTAVYAKVDRQALRSLARPWPGAR